LIVAPKLLLLDEPAQGLDAPLRAEFYEVLRQVRADFKTPVLLVTHDLDECFELGEEMLILHEGKIVQSGSPRKILDQPANIEVARLLGAFNLIPCEIRALDPGRNTSKIQMGEFEFDGPYFPGRFKGDRVTLCVRPEQLAVTARLGRPGPNQISAKLSRAVEKPHGMRLEFEGGITADLPRAEFDRQRDNKDWLIEFPASALRVL
jgi:ABC-type sulfate/molybdate transport systems ATPase subunit